MARQPNTREMTPDDMPGRQPAPIDLMVDREPEQIELVDKPITMDYAAQLQFNEDELLIRLERNAEKFQAPAHTFTVNGRSVTIPVGVNALVKRKFVEVIARSQPYTVQTDVGDATVDRPHNRLVRYQSAKYPFSVLRDPSPMGYEWLQRIALES
jgi:hypothetical protein